MPVANPPSLPADAERRVRAKQWFHSIEIAPGFVTPGRVPLDYLRDELKRLRFPESFEGLSVLDIGAWDGFFSFEAERRGAARVVAYDVTPADYQGFALAKELSGSRVEYVQGSVYDLSPERVGTFDVVLFLGVLYHLRYPLLALDKLHAITNGYVLVESHHLDNRVILADGTSVPLAAIDSRLSKIALYQFYKDDQLSGDFSNWFGLNRQALEEGMQSAGFRPEFLNAWADRIAFKAHKLPGLPEYQRESYEGLRWERQPDGSVWPVYPLREKKA